jgi:2-dehydropantoate 2-reductase
MESIVVLGGGSLGLLLAGKLNAAGSRAELWTRTEEQALRLEREGVAIEDAGGGRTVVAVRAQALEHVAARRNTTVLLALKQTALTDELLERLAGILTEGCAIAAFCNGIGHFDRLRRALPGVKLAAAVTTEAALRTDARTVVHTGRGHIWLGPAPLFDEIPPRYAEMPGRNRLQEAESRLVQAGFSVILSNDMKERMLRKLLVNAVINPLTALLRIRNGELTSTPQRLRLVRSLFDETAGILQAYGIPEDDRLWDELLDVCERTAHNRSSMLQDALAARPTEIDAINGAVCRLAKRQGLSAPWNEKISALVKALAGG